MTQYELRHPICGAKWEAVYEGFPTEVECIQCRKLIKPTYYPIILVVNARKGKSVKEKRTWT